ncbi:MAG: hypothetical protein K2K05_11720 [Muribaculaceae bacterium]|nr:hypothetical protein [Muribaculaceae bacterium]
MRKFIIKTICISSIFVIFFVMIARIYSWCAKYNHFPFIEAYEQKEKLLLEVPQPRIIFQGGSNVTYGILSEEVEDSIQIHTANIAVQAGLGLRLMLSLVSENCREGDVLVLSPEYQHFYGWAYGKEETLAILTMSHPNIAKHYNSKQIMTAVKGIPDAFQILRNEFCYAIKDIVGGSSDNKRYKTQVHNSHGDDVFHMSNVLDSHEIEIIPFQEKFDEEYFNEFCATVDTLKNRGVNVLIFPPTVYDKVYKIEKDKMQFVADRLRKAGHPFEYDQNLSIYDIADMYDTQNHLNKTGTEKRTHLTIEFLRNKLK